MSSQEYTDYFTSLLANGEDNLHICPSCFEHGRRKHRCTNMVFLLEDGLVCCYLGDKYEISEEAFSKKVAELKESRGTQTLPFPAPAEPFGAKRPQS